MLFVASGRWEVSEFVDLINHIGFVNFVSTVNFVNRTFPGSSVGRAGGCQMRPQLMEWDEHKLYGRI